MTALTFESVGFPQVSPLEVFAAAGSLGSDFRCFWSEPDDDLTYVAVGSAAAWISSADSSAESNSVDSRFSQAQEFIDGLDFDGPAPKAFGGFAFSSDQPHTSTSDIWQQFPAGKLVIPKLLLTYRGAGSSGSEFEMVDAVIARTSQADGTEFLSRFSVQVSASSVQTPPDSPAAHAEHSPTSNCQAIDNFNQSATASYRKCLDACLHSVQSGQLTKVIAARVLAQHCALPAERVLGNLLGRSPANATFAFGDSNRIFMGATPELLLRQQGRQLESLALAGSAKPNQAAELFDNPKELAEHAIVLTQIRDCLERAGAQLDASPPTEIMDLGTIAHLSTQISGRAAAGGIFDLVARLHPSPSVGGFPTGDVLRFIAETEELDRGWYAGPVGWVSPGGDGSFYVALRSMVLDAAQQISYCFAGSGIVEGSVAEKEVQETLLKLQTAQSAAR